jgi:hypothetical protein
VVPLCINLLQVILNEGMVLDEIMDGEEGREEERRGEERRGEERRGEERRGEGGMQQ